MFILYPKSSVISWGRTGLLMDISQVLASMNISIITMNAKTDKNNDIVWTLLTFDVVSAGQLDNIIKSMRKIRGVTRAYRINV
ncbi:MAG: ACT domain-containing protein [Clostridia bacterium]|nr:ACT domain-containing protein [Clostridia bacterium]